ncbi:terpene synthase family protein [Chitinophaga polysaccharea]|uniref:terpene synthase family protein n=1 Tax=Chitinophaga polysaccharea TaxID=1293035 RepID=UPI001159DFA9|nr:terpene synthase [Chitinophaga polysaccharea]
MSQQILSMFRYPFPTLKNPFAEALQELTENEWIDNEYRWLYQDDESTRLKYKKTKTAHIASQWFPTANYERLKPVCRLMLWTLYNDDMYEEATPEEISMVHKNTVAILKGEITAEDSGLPLGRLLSSLRAELLTLLTPESLHRFVTALSGYFTGLEQEMIYKVRKAFPSVEDCLAIRESSLCLRPFLELADIETGQPLPDEIHHHPVMQRLMSLAIRMMVCFNEVQSVAKDEATDGVYYNLVKAIQHNRNLSLEDACMENLRIHSEYLREFIYLQSFLPDFGNWQDAVVNRVHYISMTLSGWKSISFNLPRYNSTDGFPAVSALKQHKWIHQ